MEERREQEISYGQWLVPDPKSVFLLVHGLGTHAGRWEAAADFFIKKGISSYAIELPKDIVGSYSKRALRLYGMVKKDNPAKKIFLIGESLGAVISFLICAGSPGLFSGLIAISPAFATKNKIPLRDYVSMVAPLFYDPGKQFTLPFDSAMCTRDVDYRNRLDQDPCEYRSISSRTIFDILLAQVRARMVRKMPLPVLFLIAEEDKIVDPQCARDVFKALAAKDKTLIGFPGMYHALSIELGREKVFEEMSRWVEDRSRP